MRLVIGFITEHCEIRSLTRIWNSSQTDYCRLCCDEEELETVEHLLCKCPSISKLRLRLNSVSRADIKALHRFIRGLSGFISVVAFSPFCFVWSVWVLRLPSSPSSFLSFDLTIPSIILSFQGRCTMRQFDLEILYLSQSTSTSLLT